MPSWVDLGAAALLGLGLGGISGALGQIHKKLENSVFLGLTLVSLIILFIIHPWDHAIMEITVAMFGALFPLRWFGGFKTRAALRERLRFASSERLSAPRQPRRLLLDLGIMGLLSLGLVAMLTYAQGSTAMGILPILALFALLQIAEKMFVRLLTHITAQIYYLPEERTLLLISRLQSYALPLSDLVEVHTESTPDILKLHPLLNFFGSRTDFTTNLGEVTVLTFRGMTLYLTVEPIERWTRLFSRQLEENRRQTGPSGSEQGRKSGEAGRPAERVPNSTRAIITALPRPVRSPDELAAVRQARWSADELAAGVQAKQNEERQTGGTQRVMGIPESRTVAPIWSIRSWHRLLARLYFAAAVQGISAYTTLALVLYAMQAPPWLMAAAAVGWWIFNLLISDRILAAALDVQPVTDERLQQLSQEVFRRAGIPGVRLYQTDSRVHNAMAFGVNIGRSMIVCTTAVLQLPAAAVEAVLAHEAVHVRRRDVLTGQLARLLAPLALISVLMGLITLFPGLKQLPWALFPLVVGLMLAHPLLQSIVGQFLEVRADRLGSALLSGGSRQMADALHLLAAAQDRSDQAAMRYSSLAAEPPEEKGIDGEHWLLRLLDFQFMSHPPIRWRIQDLSAHPGGFNKLTLKRWMESRWRASLP